MFNFINKKEETNEGKEVEKIMEYSSILVQYTPDIIYLYIDESGGLTFDYLENGGGYIVWDKELERRITVTGTTTLLSLERTSREKLVELTKQKLHLDLIVGKPIVAIDIYVN